ncbi:hypothetical protein F5I97DRAFT_1267285 [Phlebopus sp. FC_14]|nr:hypothetical protein F5I97DRAFT_1267285 [Phlebopus sp. FC_14]
MATTDGNPEVPNGLTSGSLVDPDNDVVPPAHERRTLVLCFDGTGDQFSTDLFSMLKKDDPSQQMVYYQAGIGTYTIPEIATPFWSNVSKTIDMMIGNHLDAHVMGGYEFLMQNYEAGDKICIFGFSRGAYTARALAGMIHKVGLLPRCNYQQVPFAYKMYSQDDETGWRQSTAFKKAFSINVDIEFVGVWDTVSSVGVIPHRLPFTKTSDNIRYFRHAMALDERRARFKANYWNRPTQDDQKLGVKRDEMPRSQKKLTEVLPDPLKLKNDQPGQRELERQYSQDIDKTDVLEVWFAGCHCDVGGGSVENNTRNSLARIPLRWMIRECFKTNSGILFHRSKFKKIGIDPATLYPYVQERPPAIYQAPAQIPEPGSPGSTKPLVVAVVKNDPTVVTNSAEWAFASEEEEDWTDALSPIYDQLKIAPYWWILEVIPQKIRYQRDEDDSWTKEITVNMGRGRHIPMQEIVGVKFHRSVKIRMEADALKGGKYVPKATLKVEPQWVD